jgi:hypothetical protein
MLLDRTKTTKHGVRAGPPCELRVDELDKFDEGREVSVMEPEPAKEFPHAFDWVKLWAVRGKKEQH